MDRSRDGIHELVSGVDAAPGEPHPDAGRLARIGFDYQGALDPATAPGWYIDDIQVSVQAPPDADSDGLPSDWETKFGLHLSDGTGLNGSAGDADGDGKTNLEEYEDGTHPRGFHKRYLAEGALNAFFDTRLALLNVGTDVGRILLRFLQPGGITLPRFEQLATGRRRTLARPELQRPRFSRFLDGRRIRPAVRASIAR